jgi:hypothetical protein
VAFLSPLTISFADFLVRFSIPSYVFHFVYLQCIKGRLTLSIYLKFTLKKKKKKKKPPPPTNKKKKKKKEKRNRRIRNVSWDRMRTVTKVP